jgi:hypothetical protein
MRCLIATATATATVLAAVIGYDTFDIRKVDAFLPPMPNANKITTIRPDDITAAIRGVKRTTTISPIMAAKRTTDMPSSMRERRKQRARRGQRPPATTPPPPRTPAVVHDDRESHRDGSTAATSSSSYTISHDDESYEIANRASSLIESQRRSVECLTYVRNRIERSFPARDAVGALIDRGYYACDGFLSSPSTSTSSSSSTIGDDVDDDGRYGDALLSEMMSECTEMLSNDKLTRDITRLIDGEYVTNIVGGEAYVNCPRLTEYVVSLTRHLPPLLEGAYKNTDATANAIAGDDDVCDLDDTASMATLRMYDRKTRLGAETLLTNRDAADDDTRDDASATRPYGVVCDDVGDGTERDARRLTALLFLSSDEWDGSTCGGGITMKDGGERIHAMRDRIVLLRSDTCYHRMEPWWGGEGVGLDRAGCAIVHFVKRRTTKA